jgi:hypothetical protein
LKIIIALGGGQTIYCQKGKCLFFRKESRFALKINLTTGKMMVVAVGDAYFNVI